MQVILDTNILVNDFFMKSSNFKILFEFSKKLPFDIIIPEVVEDEVANKYSEMLESQYIEYIKAVQKMKSFFKSQNLDFLLFDTEIEVQNYKEFLRELVERKKVKTLPYPKTSHKSMVLHALSRRKSFNSKGGGYRDKLIFDSIICKYSCPQETIVFISHNRNDFGAEPKLEDDLFVGTKVSNRFRFEIYNSLSSFINKYIIPITDFDDSINTIPELSKIAGLNISEWIFKEIKNMIYDNGVGHAIMGIEDEYGTAMLHKFDSVKNMSVANVIELDDETITCDIIIEGTFIMYISGDQDDCIRSEALSEILGYTASDGKVDISTWQPETAEITFSIVIDKTYGEITAYSPKKVKNEIYWTTFDW